MKNTTSFIRHAIVSGVTVLAVKKGLDPTAADGLANFIAMGAISTVTWAAVKFLPAGFAQILGFNATF